MVELEMTKKIENKTNFEGLRIFGVWDTKLSNGDFVAPHSHRDVEEIEFDRFKGMEMDIDDIERGQSEAIRLGYIVHVIVEYYYTYFRHAEMLRRRPDIENRGVPALINPGVRFEDWRANREYADREARQENVYATEIQSLAHNEALQFERAWAAQRFPRQNPSLGRSHRK